MAWEDWVRYARTKEKGYPEKNPIFNGNFERETTGSPFDWQIAPATGVAAAFERDPSGKGRQRRLRLTFDGTQNVGDVGVAQQFYLVPGRYAFRAKVRSEGLTTDQGVAVTLTARSAHAASPSFDVTTDALRRTTDWVETRATFDVGGDGELVTLRLTRKPSLKFDRLVRGTVWLTDVMVLPAEATQEP